MEILQLNNINTLQSNNSIQKDSILNNVDAQNTLSTKDSIDKIEINDNRTSSSFINNVSSNIEKISDLQNSQSLISNQLEIATKIVQVTTNTIKEPSLQLDDSQPEIKSLMDNFNAISEKIKVKENMETTGIFFDGIVGSKPLSSEEIYNAIQENKSKLLSSQSEINHEMKNTITNTKNTISNEKDKIEVKIEYKEVDYVRESTQFSSLSINNKSDIVPSQANALPQNSEKLLA